MGIFTPDFTLEDWQGPPRFYRFIGWRNNSAAFFVLDERDGTHLIQPELFSPASTIRFPEPPTSITKVRLLAPPFRPSRAEADLLIEMRDLAHNRGRGYPDAVEIYFKEASKRKINHPTRPEKWELIYEDAVAPKSDSDLKGDLKTIQNKVWNAWCESHGWTPDNLLHNRYEFIRRHAVDDLVSLTRVNLKMEFKNIAAVWLVDCLVSTPNSTADLDEVRKLLDARPEIVHLTPEDAERALDLTPDIKHRTLRSYCDAAKLDHTRLTRAHLSALMAVGDDRKAAQIRAGKSQAKRRIKNG